MLGPVLELVRLAVRAPRALAELERRLEVLELERLPARRPTIPAATSPLELFDRTLAR